MITDISNFNPGHQPVRDLKQMFLKRQVQGSVSEHSSTSSEITVEKLRSKITELDDLEMSTEAGHVELVQALMFLRLEAEPNA